MDQAIKNAIDRYLVPADNPDFLFFLPLLYVAKADGIISPREAMVIGWKGMNLATGFSPEEGEQKLNEFMENSISAFQLRTKLDDLTVLADGINARLSEYPPDEAAGIRTKIREACVKVAKASGPVFREKVNEHERVMLDRIFEGLEGEGSQK